MKKNSWFKIYFDEIKLNFNTGTIAWILHRISGALLLFYFLMHSIIIGSALRGGQSFDVALAKVQIPLFHVIEIGLIGVVFFHLLNGLRLVIIDFTLLSKTHKIVFWIFVKLHYSYIN